MEANTQTTSGQTGQSATGTTSSQATTPAAPANIWTAIGQAAAAIALQITEAAAVDFINGFLSKHLGGSSSGNAA
jgi:hypothetical protein